MKNRAVIAFHDDDKQLADEIRTRLERRGIASLDNTFPDDAGALIIILSHSSRLSESIVRLAEKAHGSDCAIILFCVDGCSAGLEMSEYLGGAYMLTALPLARQSETLVTLVASALDDPENGIENERLRRRRILRLAIGICVVVIILCAAAIILILQ